MSEKQKSFVKGAAILMIAGLLVKVIGALYRIPLTTAITTTGMGYYNVAYPVYSMLLVVSTAGLPVAISKMVSERVAVSDYTGAHNVFRVARRVLLLLGIIMTVVMLILAGPISNAVMQDKSVFSLLAISPALFFVSILSAYRGYFQGMQMMAPTALTQVIEQVGKLAMGLSLAYAWLPMGVEYGAAGALVGVTLSEVVALFCIMVIYSRKKRGILARVDTSRLTKADLNFKVNTKKLLKIAVPVTLGACIMPIVVAIDSGVVSTNLQAIGYSAETAASMYGTLTGVVNTLVNMPAVLSSALAMSLVPAMSEAFAKKDKVLIKSRASFGVKLAVLVGLPAAVGFFLLGQPIISMLYRGLDTAELTLATQLMQMLALSILFLTIVQTTNAVLQGMGHPIKPVISLAVGAGVKVVLSIVLIRIPEINVMGAVYGTMACYIIASVMNLIFVAQESKFRASLKNHIIKPLIATAAMGAVAYIVYDVVGVYSNTVGVIAAILVALVVYFVLIFGMQTLTDDELSLMPASRKLKRFANKFKLKGRK